MERRALEGTRAIVVGGSSGIGLATTKLLARDGCRVTIAGRDRARLDPAIAELAADGHVVVDVVCDTMIEANIVRAVDVAADELGEIGVRVNSVRPGLTRTGSTPRLFENDELFGRFLDNQAIRRGGEAIDIAEAIRSMAGPESSWVTGQHLTIDGGHTLRAMPDMRPPA